MVIKEIHVRLARSSLKATLVLIAAAALSGCVVRPWAGIGTAIGTVDVNTSTRIAIADARLAMTTRGMPHDAAVGSSSSCGLTCV